jgi:N,N-dimethylformamidase
VKTILGYSDRFTVGAGDSIAFKISSEREEPFDLDIRRIIHGDVNPAGPGYQDEAVPSAVAGRYPGRRQTVQAGSFIRIPRHTAFDGLASFRLDLSLWPTTVEKPGQAIASLWDAPRSAGFVLLLDAGLLRLRLGDGTGATAELTFPSAVAARTWCHITARFDAATGTASLCVAEHAAEEKVALRSLGDPAADLLFAAMPRTSGVGETGFYNGKIEAPRLYGIRDASIGAWDFSQKISCETIVDTSPNACHGTTVQLPSRAVTGSNWRTETRAWTDAPSHYGAIHFHDDDIADAGWTESAVWTVPAGLRSGLYVARLTTDSDEDAIPFVIRPTPTAGLSDRLLLVLPSASYIAYANEHLPMDAALAERIHDHLPVFTPEDIYLAEHRELGGSLYDRHSDGSGIMTSSRLRPVLNMRAKYQSWLGGGVGSSLWQLNADTHIIGWLEQQGIAYDVVTDEDLHEDGDAILARYRCVMTGTHPEYISTAMLDSINTFQGRGGRLIYMGGNGFYWRIAFHPTIRGIIEVRRCEVGNGWITPPGESYHAFNGEYGGLWRRIGRPPQMTLGIGFIGQGFDICSYYRRMPGSHDPRAAFIFDGVTEEIIGDFGLIGGGAAGIELDSADPERGTPPHVLVLAQSENHTNTYLPTVEALLINYPGQGAQQNTMVHADMVFFETPSGGAVFSTGSIAWAGSLSHEGGVNAVSRITANVVRRFLHPHIFEV